MEGLFTREFAATNDVAACLFVAACAAIDTMKLNFLVVGSESGLVLSETCWQGLLW